ncbi:hypothetical protein [Qaidamihabitans albus]|uniref:hypothetical protein n=1 Tax=Qaidamihabitans albus TaxID=2795733 RepID=UPI0018F26BD4|nr:hypothetical protein [Qaidamihabitans albus]
MPSLTWKALGVAALPGLLVLLVSWWMGPSLFGPVVTEERQVVRATVTLPADCTTPGAEETVAFELNGEQRNGILSGCGHDQDEQLDVAVPADPGSGLIEVRHASTVRGTSDLRRPVGLALLVLSCGAGGLYAYLVVRGPRRVPALA